MGFSSGVHPFAGATFTVGNKVWTGAGSSGVGPMPAVSGSLALSPQPPRHTMINVGIEILRMYLTSYSLILSGLHLNALMLD